MQSKIKIKLLIGGILTLLFAFLNVGLKIIDVQNIGPQNSEIGFATINEFFKNIIGVNEIWYDITELLGLLPIVTVLGFGIFGLIQFIKGKSLKKVDKDLIVLAIFYVVVVAIYIFYEIVVINYRPILIEGELEPSFPSSHILLAIGIMGTAIMKFQYRIKNKVLKVSAISISSLIILCTVVGRARSGVHWFTDILGGILISVALVLFYGAIIERIKKKEV